MQVFILAFIISLFSSVCFASINFDVVTLPVRAGVTQKYLITWEDSGKPTSAVILFAGGSGEVGITKEDNLIHLDNPNNFLVRSRELFVDQHTISVVVDTPADNPGMTDKFRKSSVHANDLSKIIDDIKLRFPGIKVYLIGTSRGTISAAYTGKSLQSKVNGIILTSTISKYEGFGDFPFQSLEIPVLLVHHRDDGCEMSPYSSALNISRKYKIPLITVTGGDIPISEPCQALSEHGFLGKEQTVVNEIKKWINQEQINPSI